MFLYKNVISPEVSVMWRYVFVRSAVQDRDVEALFENKIDTQSLGETEYEDLLQQHFHESPDGKFHWW